MDGKFKKYCTKVLKNKIAQKYKKKLCKSYKLSLVLKSQNNEIENGKMHKKNVYNN